MFWESVFAPEEHNVYSSLTKHRMALRQERDVISLTRNMPLLRSGILNSLKAINILLLRSKEEIVLLEQKRARDDEHAVQ
jgi:hypothetical protein